MVQEVKLNSISVRNYKMSFAYDSPLLLTGKTEDRFSKSFWPTDQLRLLPWSFTV